jgi:hypothetical protein
MVNAMIRVSSGYRTVGSAGVAPAASMTDDSPSVLHEQETPKSVD